MKKRQKTVIDLLYKSTPITADMQECRICHHMDDRNYKLQCGHEFCLHCLENKLSCNTCSQPIGMDDKRAIWRKTHCTWCYKWISGSYDQLCENCYFEQDEDQALRAVR